MSDPQRRDIYDIYGEEGLRAGMEVGDHLKTRDALRKDWAKFQQKQVRGAHAAITARD